MRKRFRGFALEQAHDRIFDMPVPRYWWAIHIETSMTIATLIGEERRVVAIAEALEQVLDFEAIADWEGNEALARFAGRHPLEVELPQYVDSPEEFQANDTWPARPGRD